MPTTTRECCSRQQDNETAESLPPQIKTQRIPESLQLTFLASNRGKVVHKPPPDGSASKVYERNWLFQRSGVAAPLKKLTSKTSQDSHRSNRRHRDKSPDRKPRRGRRSRADVTSLEPRKSSESLSQRKMRDEAASNARRSERSLSPGRAIGKTPSAESLVVKKKRTKVRAPSPIRRTHTIDTSAKASQRQRHGSPRRGRGSDDEEVSSRRTRSPQRSRSSDSTALTSLLSSDATLSPSTHTRSTRGSSKKPSRRSKNVESTVPVKEITSYTSTTPNIAIPSPIQQSPQKFLDVMLKARGYSTKHHQALHTAYHNKPTPLQTSSWSANLVEIVRESNVEKLTAILQCGISPNPSNHHGESLVHIAARMARHEALQVMLEHGTVIQCCDTMGRTPLHDACWRAKACFTTVDTILKKDLALFRLADSRGTLPLEYVRKDQWGVWVDFLYSKRDEYWPRRQIRFEGEEAEPTLTIMPPNSRPIPDPVRALAPSMAELLVSGRMTPREVRALMDEEDLMTAATEAMSVTEATFDQLSLGTGSLRNKLNLTDDDDDDDDDDDSDSDSDSDDSDDEDEDDDEDDDLAILEQDLARNLKRMSSFKTSNKSRITPFVGIPTRGRTSAC